MHCRSKGKGPEGNQPAPRQAGRQALFKQAWNAWLGEQKKKRKKKKKKRKEEKKKKGKGKGPLSH